MISNRNTSLWESQKTKIFVFFTLLNIFVGIVNIATYSTSKVSKENSKTSTFSIPAQQKAAERNHGHHDDCLCTAKNGSGFDQTLPSQSNFHPLDPLDASEVQLSVDIIVQYSTHTFNDSFNTYPNLVIHMVKLEEPPKTQVLSWHRGQQLNRTAFVLFSHRNPVSQRLNSFEVLINLKQTIHNSQIVSVTNVTGDGEPPINNGDLFAAFGLIQDDPRFLSALAARGYTQAQIDDRSDLFFCAPLSAGFFNISREIGHRIAKFQCFDITDNTNLFLRPLAGLEFDFDFDSMSTINFFDLGPVPIPPISGVDFTQDRVGNLRRVSPIGYVHPDGLGFSVDGYQVQWQKWNFRVRGDHRTGTVINLANFDGRSVLYQGAVVDLFVPYQDPTLEWFFKTYFDAGEYGIGTFSNGLEIDDCTPDSVFLNLTLANFDGTVTIVPGAICIFERYAGNHQWSHIDNIFGIVNEKRVEQTLVVRQIATVGNYDYVFDIEFWQDGQIKFYVAATGIMEVKAVHTTFLQPGNAQSDADTAFGTLVANNTVATFHDHFFNFRLDLDVDGVNNNFVKGDLVTQLVPSSFGTPRKSYWKFQPNIIQNEGNARFLQSMTSPSAWLVQNPSVKTNVGNPVGYQINPGANAVSLLTNDDYPQIRARFTDFQMWVTRNNASEKYAAARYPNQNGREEGLPMYQLQNRSIANQDVVTWFTLGFHHLTRQEDYPIMNLASASFEVRPFNFFNHNGALDLPKVSPVPVEEVQCDL